MSDHFEVERWKSIHSTSGRIYKAIELIAPGRNAATFLAVGVSSPYKGLLFAIKVFRRLSSEESRNGFLEEVRLLKNLSHPCIMPVIDEGVYYENPFLVAEYYPTTLQSAIATEIPLEIKVGFAVQILSALEYLGSLKPMIVHRDLKPGNIFVRGHSCIVGDFGLKKALAVDDKQDGQRVKESETPGMPLRYRTPELIRYYNKEPGVDLSKSDVFQAGLTLAELFTGKNPQNPSDDYGGPISMSKISRINAGGAAAGINALLQRMLRTNPTARPDAATVVKGWSGVYHDVIENLAYLRPKVIVSQ